MEWVITETGIPTSQDVDNLGNKFLIGNGYLGYRGTLEEYTREQKTAVIVSGLYDQVGDQWREPVNLPNGAYVQVYVDGKPLHVLAGEVQSHAQALDFAHGVHLRRTVFRTGDGKLVLVLARRFASLAQPHLLCVEYTLQPSEDCTLTILSGIDGDVWELNGPHLEEIVSSLEDGVLCLAATTHENDVPVAVCECLSLAGRSDIAIQEDERIQQDEKRIQRLVQVTARRNQVCTVYKFVAFYTGNDTVEPLEMAKQLCRQAAELGFDRLYQEHCALWDGRWNDCDIQIEGDPEAQQALRFSMYHLLAIVPTHSDRTSIPARGLSGQVYKGAIFWDTEIFMLPFFIHSFPKLARNLLLYRYHTLDGARRKAAEYGCRGAFYAWESQDNGDDACTLFNITDVFTNRPMRTYFRDKQVHISGDIAYAFWQYFSHTGDDSIWLEGGTEVVFECTRFYLSTIYYHPDKGRYEVLDVTGPDEYHERVHNNAFTNRMVVHTFEVCLQVAAHLRQNAPEYLVDLVTRLGMAADLAMIAQATSGLFQPDLVPGVIPQFDGYFSLEDVPLPTLLGRKLNPNEYLGGGNGLATTTQIIKQADVVLMLFLFSDRYTREIKAANWEYYEPRTEHGSSLSACSYSLIAAQLGKVEWAYRYFMKTAVIDLLGEGKQYVGTLYIGGTHPAGNGGAWISAVFGLCGIHCTLETITIDPHLPAHWSKVSLPLIFGGQRVRITLTHETVQVTPSLPLETPLTISVKGQIAPIHAGQGTILPYKESML